MSSITVDAVLLAPVADLSDMIELDASAVSEKDQRAGEVRGYANGRQRSISRVGVRREIGLSFDVQDDRDLLATIQSWKGELLLYRDARGRKVYGVFYEAGITENVTVDVVSVSLTLTEVTYSEEV